MALWDDYAVKSTPEDTDTLMMKDNSEVDGPNKRVLLSGLFTWLQNKIHSLSDVEPIQFRRNNSQDDKLHFGFGAQSVKKLLQKYGMDDSAIVYYDENQDKYYLNYIEFIPLLVDKVQKLDAENKELKSKLADMESRLERLEKLLGKE